MKQKFSSISFSVLLYALGIHQLVYLYDTIQGPVRCALYLLHLYSRKLFI